MESLDPLAALRGATASRHAILDAGLALAQADASLHDYRRHLLLLRAWLEPIEAWLANFDDGPQGADVLPPADRIGSIDADLALGAGACSRMPATPGDAWPRDANAAYRWGVCYVIEGSQLGGAVLYRRLAARLAPHPLNYLKGRGEGPGPRWRTFSAALREQVRGSAQIADACAGACDAFDRILALRTAYR
jgi:heme oxygenase